MIFRETKRLILHFICEKENNNDSNNLRQGEVNNKWHDSE